MHELNTYLYIYVEDTHAYMHACMYVCRYVIYVCMWCDILHGCM